MRIVVLVAIVVIVLALAFLGLRACGAFNSGLESELKTLKAEPRSSTPADAKVAYEKAAAFVDRVGQFEEPPEGLMRKARELQLQRGAEWAWIEGTGTAKKAVESARKFLDKWGDRVPTEEEVKKAGDDAKPATEVPVTALTEEERASGDHTSGFILRSGKPKKEK